MFWRSSATIRCRDAPRSCFLYSMLGCIRLRFQEREMRDAMKRYSKLVDALLIAVAGGVILLAASTSAGAQADAPLWQQKQATTSPRNDGGKPGMAVQIDVDRLRS